MRSVCRNITALLAGVPPLLSSTAAEPASYYQAAEGLTGPNLKAALHDIVDGHKALTYTATREALIVTDAVATDPTKITLIYSRREELASRFIVNGSNDTREWNREHLWPNSHGIDGHEPSYSDLHNLRPADVNVNATRANLLFDESSAVQNPIIPGDPEAPLTSRDSNSWEPPAALKGDIARALFYMDVRYEGEAPSEPNLMLTDSLTQVTNNGTSHGRLTTLLLWHLSDPPSAEERMRNDLVFGLQLNRNPFVDRPQWVLAVFGDPLLLTATVPEVGSTFTLSWWAELNGVTVETAMELDQSVWTTLNTAVSVVNGTKREFKLPKPDSKRFYRLRYFLPDRP